MGHYVQTNVKALVAQWDVSGDLNACALEHGAELQDGTTFGKTTRATPEAVIRNSRRRLAQYEAIMKERGNAT